MISQSKVEEYPVFQIDDLKELMDTMKGELRSSLTKEILKHTKKRVPEEDDPERKLEKTKKRRLFGASNNSFTAKAAANG